MHREHKNTIAQYNDGWITVRRRRLVAEYCEGQGYTSPSAMSPGSMISRAVSTWPQHRPHTLTTDKVSPVHVTGIAPPPPPRQLVPAARRRPRRPASQQHRPARQINGITPALIGHKRLSGRSRRRARCLPSQQTDRRPSTPPFPLPFPLLSSQTDCSLHCT